MKCQQLVFGMLYFFWVQERDDVLNRPALLNFYFARGFKSPSRYCL